MKRTLPPVLFALLCLAGCTRSADPLDWKIRADGPDDLLRWVDQDLALMPRDLAGEVFVCLTHIRVDTPLGPNGQQQIQRFCQRVDGRTVRDALIEGHELANRMLRARITNESNAVIRLLSTADTLDKEQLKKHEGVMNQHLLAKGNYEQRLRESEERIAALRARPAK